MLANTGAVRSMGAISDFCFNARVMVTGRITAIVVDPINPNTIYVGTAHGGVWKTTDGGLNWVPKSDNEVSLAIGALVMDPGNNQLL